MSTTSADTDADPGVAVHGALGSRGLPSRGPKWPLVSFSPNPSVSARPRGWKPCRFNLPQPKRPRLASRDRQLVAHRLMQVFRSQLDRFEEADLAALADHHLRSREAHVHDDVHFLLIFAASDETL